MSDEKNTRISWLTLFERTPFGFKLFWRGLFVLLLINVFLLSPFHHPVGNVRPAIAYVAQDEVYAEAILRDFRKSSSIHVESLYDSEAVKTVGLVNRLLAERDHPQCDVFWGNEEMRTRQLAAEGVFAKWAAFGHRSRQLVVNTNFVHMAAPSPRPSPPGRERMPEGVPGRVYAPKSLLELTNEVWRGKVALAYPLFGTTSTHFLALRQHWGDAGWLEWCRALVANKAFVVDGNSVVVKLVAKGEAWIGLTDSDDIAAAQREGEPVAAVSFAETLLIPNTVAIVKSAPHAENAKRLFTYLQEASVTDRLIAAKALESDNAQSPDGLKPDWDELLSRLDRDTSALKEIFLR